MKPANAGESGPLDLTLAGFHIRLLTPDPALRQRWSSRFNAFLLATPPPLSPAEGSLVLTVTRRPVDHFLSLASNVMELRWSLHADRLTFASSFEEGELDLAAGVGHVELAVEGDPENLLRVYLAYRCLQHGGLLMHSSGAVRNGWAYLFFGPSGAGKTTIALLSEKAGYPVLGDDIVALRPFPPSLPLGTPSPFPGEPALADLRLGRGQGGERFFAYSLPFGNREDFAPRKNLRAPIAALYRLQKSTEQRIAPLPGVQALTELISATPFIHIDAALTEQALAVAQSLQRAVPVRQLLNYPPPSVWSVLPEPLQPS